MALTIPVVEASNPQGLIQTATSLGQDASGLSVQIDTQRASIDGLRDKWQGPASDAAYAKAQLTLRGLQRLHDGLTSTQSAMHDGGTALAESRTNLLRAVDQLKAQGWQVAADGTVSAVPGGPLDKWARLSPGNQTKIDQLAANGSVLLKTELANFDTADRRLDGKLRDAVQMLGSKSEKGPGGDPLPEAPSYDTGDYIPVGKSPEEVKKWWDALPQSEKDRLPHDWPEKIGSLNGVPVVARDAANRNVMQRDLDRPAEVAKARGVTVEEVFAHPEKYGMAGEMMTRYNNAVKVKEALAADSKNTHGAPTFLQVYDPTAFKGDGRAAIAIGNPDLAKNTAVVVPGTSNSVESGWLAGKDATNLFNEANAADPANPTAVVAWMGYDAPDALYDPRVGTTGLAHQGGQLLADDVNALNATHDVDAVGKGHMTVLGHSYGSTTVSDAAAGYGMHTDDVVLVGCPGTDLAKNAGDFHLNDGGHLFVGAASTDPVTKLGGVPQLHIPGTDFTASLGSDPAHDGFGSTRFKAEVPGINTPWGDHSEYYTAGGESLFSMSDIVSGHGDALAHDGMLAPHRTTAREILGDLVPLFPSDPETLRPATSGHSHQ